MSFEIDGPPTAWFETNKKRYTYTTYALGRRDGNVGELVLSLISHIKRMKEDGYIVWRRRPEFTFERASAGDLQFGIEPNPDQWKLTYRCAVIPFNELIPAHPVPEKQEGAPIFYVLEDNYDNSSGK